LDQQPHNFGLPWRSLDRTPDRPVVARGTGEDEQRRVCAVSHCSVASVEVDEVEPQNLVPVEHDEPVVAAQSLDVARQLAAVGQS
jgi:hypothetical protein